jgi:hypothetical protein
MNNLIWLSDNDIINLSTVTHINLGEDVAVIIFVGGERFTLGGEDATKLYHHFKKNLTDARIPSPQGH